jgi:hypothetical protein
MLKKIITAEVKKENLVDKEKEEKEVSTAKSEDLSPKQEKKEQPNDNKVESNTSN